MKTRLFALLAALPFALFAHEHTHDHHQHSHDCDAPGVHELHISPRAQKTMGLKLVQIEKRSVESTLELPGTFVLAPDAFHAIPSTIAGRLSLKVKPLEHFEKDATLFTIESFELKALEEELKLLEARLEKYTSMNLKNAELSLELAKKKIEVERLSIGLEVKAPHDGIVESLEVSDGAYVEVGTKILNIMNPHHLQLKVFTCPSDIARLECGMKAKCRGVEGTVLFGLDENSLTRALIDFPEGGIEAKPGERAEATIVTGKSAAEAFAVPSKAIVLNGVEPIVFVKDEDEDPSLADASAVASATFLAIPVTPMISGNGWTEITGIEDDDTLVVVEGAYELKLALEAQGGKKEAAGHFHADGTFHEGND